MKNDGGIIQELGVVLLVFASCWWTTRNQFGWNSFPEGIAQSSEFYFHGEPVTMERYDQTNRDSLFHRRGSRQKVSASSLTSTPFRRPRTSTMIVWSGDCSVTPPRHPGSACLVSEPSFPVADS